jgi:transcription elongation factor Elf1
MSRKMTCPACNSHTSSVLAAFEEGRPCPNCGLSAGAALEIEGVRQRRADEDLKARLEAAIKERDAAQRELRLTKARLERITELVGRPLEDEESPW